MFEDGSLSPTSQHQYQLEQAVRDIYAHLLRQPAAESKPLLLLNRLDHIHYLHSGLQRLPRGYVSLDASRPWICYWILHALALLDAPLPAKLGAEEVANFLRSCQASEGAFGGGPRQAPHLAPSYASVAALVTLGGEDALGIIDRQGMQAFLQAMAIPAAQGGGFRLCQGGEVDVRGCYTAMAIAHMLGLDKTQLAAKANLADYLRACQTYEGGIGGEPGAEAHGGYTYCGLAAACLADCTDVLDLPALHAWAVSMQGDMEGGFRGRTNKLVDGCYSFWQGSLFALLHTLQPDLAAHLQHGSNEPAAECGSADREPWHAARDLLTRACQAAEAAQVAADDAVRQAFRQASPFDGSSDAPAASPEALAKTADAQQAAQRAAHSLEAIKVSSVMLCPSKLQQRDMQHSSDPSTGVHAPLPPGIHAAPLQHACHRLSPNSANERSTGVCSNVQSVETSPMQNVARETHTACAAHNGIALQLWILAACQGPRGGLRDKPGKPPDYYHTCYCLSGLAAMQHFSGLVLGPPGNQLQAVDPLCNVLRSKLAAARASFLNQNE